MKIAKTTSKMKKRTVKPPEGMVTYQKAATKLGLGHRTLQRMVSQGRIPEAAMFRTPGRLFFRDVELDKILEGGGIE